MSSCREPNSSPSRYGRGADRGADRGGVGGVEGRDVSGTGTERV